MISKDKFNERFKSLSDKVLNYENELKSLSGNTISSDTVDSILDGSFDELYWSMNDKQKREFWINAVDRIEVSKGWNINIIL